VENVLEAAFKVVTKLKDAVGEALVVHPVAGLAWGLLQDHILRLYETLLLY